MMIQIMGAFLAVVSFSLILELPKRYVGYAGLVGAAGWFVYLKVNDTMESVIAAAFISSLAVAFISHIFARIFKAPVTVFLVAGILPSVPGSSIYRCVYYVIRSTPELSDYYLIETLQIAGSIAMAIFVMDSLFRLAQKNERR